ncbi:MAG: hypothetical protein WDO68_03945 [Gammaproteobacteria bacterium]
MPGRSLSAAAAILTGMLLMASAALAQSAVPAPAGVQGVAPPVPGTGGVLVALLIAVGLLFGSTQLVKRWRPALMRLRGLQASAGLRTLDRTIVSKTLSVYLIETDGAKFLVAEGRHGVALTPVTMQRASDASGLDALPPHRSQVPLQGGESKPTHEGHRALV